MTYIIDLKEMAIAQTLVTGVGVIIPASLYLTKNITESQLRNYARFYIPYCVVTTGALVLTSMYVILNK